MAEEAPTTGRKVSPMPELPPELLILAPLALATGMDLYLTLLVVGAAPTTPWWDHPLPGALGELDSVAILVTTGAFYLLEFAAERFPTSALLWNAFHAVIRPVSGALIALLLLDGQGLPVLLAGSALAASLASLAHAVRSGSAILRWLSPTRMPHVLLVSLLEDAVVLGLVTLSLDLPRWALGVSIVLVVLAAPAGPSALRAFAFAVRLVMERAFQTLTQRRWVGQDELPGWVRQSLADDVLAPGGGLRGSLAGGYRLPGTPRFTIGWVVVRGGPPLFVRRHGSLDLGALTPDHVSDTGLFRRVDFTTSGEATSCLFFGVNGPSEESLRAEFLLT